jgi:hypothetical protein
VFETKTELADLQRLLDDSFARAPGIKYSGFDSSHRLSATQLAGFQGVRLVAVATVNSKGEPRAAPRSAAFLHGKFYLAANSKSTMVRRLSMSPLLGITYFENHLLIMGHGTAAPVRAGTAAFDELGPEWEDSFEGGKDALKGTDLLVRVDATHMMAFAVKPDQYPGAWKGGHPHAKRTRKAAAT